MNVVSGRKLALQLNQNANVESDIAEQLSSKRRINKASDDITAQLLSDKLTSNSTNLTRGIRNLGDAADAVEVATDGLDALDAVVDQITDLATTASNLVTSSDIRSDINTEAQNLYTEYQRIISSATYNGNALLGSDSTNRSISVQAVPDGVNLALPNNLNATTLTLDLTTATGAETALETLEAVESVLATQRGKLVGTTTIVSSAAGLNEEQVNNLEVAKGRINDINEAQTLAESLSFQIKTSLSEAVFAQANLTSKKVYDVLTYAPRRKLSDG